MQHSRTGDGVGTCALAKAHRRPLFSCSGNKAVKLSLNFVAKVSTNNDSDSDSKV